tara:strand:- start:1146 stop:1469 length:324 start_codon:yes stop_codon:yes gene_type:complete
VYRYRATIKKVYDGDTVTADIDLGFGVTLVKQKLRLLNIDTPEVRGEERDIGLLCRDRLRDRILNENVTIKTYKDKKGKYGRWLVEIFLKDENINEWMLEENLAKKY